MRFVPLVTTSGGQAGFKMLSGWRGRSRHRERDVGGSRCRWTWSAQVHTLDSRAHRSMVSEGWPILVFGLQKTHMGSGVTQQVCSGQEGRGSGGNVAAPRPELGAEGGSAGKGEQGAAAQGPGQPRGLCPEPPADTGVLSIWHNCTFYFQKEKGWFEQVWPPRRPSGAGARPPPALSGHRPAMLFQGLVQADSRWEHGK